jgi:hypothetical protein
MKLATGLHIMQKFKMSFALYSLSLYALMASCLGMVPHCTKINRRKFNIWSEGRPLYELTKECISMWFWVVRVLWASHIYKLDAFHCILLINKYVCVGTHALFTL